MLKKLQASLATEAGAPDPGRHRYTVAVLLAVVAATVAGWLFELRAPAVIAGVTAVLSLVAASGQSVPADLRVFRRFVPALALVMAVGPMLVDFPVAAGLLVAGVVFGSGMSPALGERYRTLGQIFAAATLVSTTTGIASEQPPLVLFLSAASGAVSALLLRVLVGTSDPGRANRNAVARALTARGPGVVEQASAAWRADGRSSWLGEVLAGAARFRSARETLLAQAQRSDRAEAQRLRDLVAGADEIAAELARAVRSRVCTGLTPPARAGVADSLPEQDVPEAARGMDQGFDRIRRAVLGRDVSPGAPAAPGGRRRAFGTVQAHLSLRSSLFRHALRCTLAVGVGMVIVFLLSDPSASTLLLCLYVVLQPAARDSMSGAFERTAGAVLGVAALAGLIAVLPVAFLLVPLILAMMLLQVETLRGDYRVLLGALIAVTVVDQAMELQQRLLVNAAISFAANAAIGAALALGVGYIGYLVLPGSRAPDARGTVRVTVWSVSELLRSVLAAGRGAELRQALRSAHVLALRRTQDLLGLPAVLEGDEDADPDEVRATRAAAVALDALRQNLATLAFRPGHELATTVPALRAVDDLLGGDTTARIPDTPGDSAPATELLAASLLENALHARAAIDEVFGYDQPWKNYTISFVRPEHLRIR